jgi:hypothetical protein
MLSAKTLGMASSHAAPNQILPLVGSGLGTRFTFSSCHPWTWIGLRALGRNFVFGFYFF